MVTPELPPMWPLLFYSSIVFLSVSTPLLLRNIPQIFANHSIIGMCLNSRKSSIFKPFGEYRPNMPRYTEGLLSYRGKA